ncbi:diguanylate cyclase [bacterium]|nr:diguanylate cyclase [bacterium]
MDEIQENLTTQAAFQQTSAEVYQRLAFTDELTGLRNNRFLKYRAPAYISAARKARVSLCLAMMDMDGFKKVNDTYGHKAGDTLLANFGKMIADYIAKRGIPIRYAGDEFAAILYNIDKPNAKSFFDGFLRKVNDAEVDIGDGVSLPIRISIGLASYPNDAEEYESLFKRADEALYAAKDSGKNRVITYPDEGKLVAPGNISTLFPVDEMVGFEEVFTELKLHTVDRVIGSKSIQEIALVCGGRGSGKTRLLQELKKSAENRGMSTIYATGMPSQNNPYAPLIKAISDPLNRDQDLLKEIAVSLTLAERRELASSIPNLDTLPAATTPGEQEGRNTLIFKALNKILFGLLRRGRVLIVIDDAHLADQSSLQFLDSFVSEFSNSKIDLAFGIITQAEGGAESNLSALVRAIPKIAQSSEVFRTELSPLRDLAIAGIIYQITGHIKIPPVSLNALLARTRGNPLFVEELLKLAIERGLIQYDGTNWKVDVFSEENLPESIEEIAEERAEALPSIDKKVLSRAAVIGENFNVKVLSEIIGKDEQEVQDTLEAARRAHIIQEDLSGESDYAFHSDASRNAFYNLINTEDRKEIHYKVAEVEKKLNEGHLDEIMDKLAYHFQEAERWDKAVEVLSASGSRQTQAQIPDAVRRMLHRRLYVDDMVSKKQLSPEELQNAFLALKDLRIAIQSYRFYPPQNENVRKSISKTYKQIFDLLQSAPLLSLSLTPDALLINAQEPQTDSKDQHLVSEYNKLLSRYNLNGVIFMQGLSVEELTNFISIFKLPREDVVDRWTEVIEEKQLKNIKPDQTVYVAVGAHSSQLEGNKSVRLGSAPSEEEQAEIAKEIVSKVDTLINQFRGESEEFLKALQSGGMGNETTNKLIDVLKELGGFMPQGMMKPQLNVTAQFQNLQQSLKAHPQAEEKVSEAKSSPSKQEHGRHGVIGSTMRTWIGLLEADNKVEKAKAVQNLIREGEESIEACINGIMDEEELKTRQLMAVILNKIGERGVKMFSRTLAKDLSPSDLISLISVAEFFRNDIGVQNRLSELAFSPYEVLRNAALDKLKDFPAKLRLGLLERALESSDTRMVIEGLSRLGESGMRDKLPMLLEYIDKKDILSRLPDTSFVRAAMKSLGDMKAVQAIDPLIKLSAPGGLFKKAMSDEIRSLAVETLANIGGGRTLKVLKKLSKRKNDPVGLQAAELIDIAESGSSIEE